MGLIRLLLACGVILGHSSTIYGYTPLNGNLAVQVFYVISGFYMAMVLTEKYNFKTGRKSFYRNRALKIYPPYLIVLVLLVIWALLVFHLNYPGTLDFYTKYASPSATSIIYLIIVNLFLFGLETLFLLAIHKNGNLYFTPDFNRTSPNVYNFAFNPIAWTIGIELLFYLAAPWLAKRKIYVLVMIFTISVLIRIITAQFFFDGPPWNYMFFPSQFMFFIAGILSYRGYLYLKRQRISKKVNWAIYVLFIGLLLLYFQFFKESYYKNLILFGATTLFVPFIFDLTKNSRFDRLIGDIAYPVYISQFLIIRIISIKAFPKIFGIGFTALILTIVFSIFLQLLIEKYIVKFKHNIGGQINDKAEQPLYC
ncbi:acyltransferase [Mucilaginibacter sp. BT774]|uniref:acyltransferase family protein n=1 Tax=Mucilaginibacter sp. BT774 TaxID=3062276 RepID=UPI0026762954|nr:acyltransferase [Mucilaginibacter sp. BT774]MDO3627479.1 acyltransferase [Mucilaginibacter sp. BT774]